MKIQKLTVPQQPRADTNKSQVPFLFSMNDNEDFSTVSSTPL